MEAYFVLIIFGGLIYWALTNRWTENDTHNFAQAARHGTRMKGK